MTAVAPSPTFRDPAGSLSLEDDLAVRRIHPDARDAALQFLASPFYQRASQRGDISPTTVDDSPGGLRFLHPRIPVPTYPWEWTHPQWLAAAELTLSLAEEALAEGWILKDATPLNILFDGPRPILVDVLSFERRDPTSSLWLAYGQYLRTFLLPLLMSRTLAWPLALTVFRRDGYEPQELYRAMSWPQRLSGSAFWPVTLPAWLGKRSGGESQPAPKPQDPELAQHILARTFASLRRRTRNAIPRTADSEWAGYQSNLSHYSAADEQQKHAWVEQVVAEFHPATVLDIGANTGEYSRLAARSGASVVALERDAPAAARLFELSRAESLPIQTIHADLARPTPAVGWENSESTALLPRLEDRFDLVMLLAVIHHLILMEQIPLSAILALMHRLTRRLLIVEWVPVSDPMFQSLMRGRDSLYGALSEQDLLSACTGRFHVLKREPLGNGRVLFLFQKLNLSPAVTFKADPERQHPLALSFKALKPKARNRRRLAVVKRLCQSIGLASLILVMNYGEMLGGGRDVRLHVPLRLTGIALAQIADILLLGLAIFLVLAPLRRTRFYPWVRLLVAIAIPPYLLSRTYTLFPVTWLAGIIPLLAVAWAAFLLLLMMIFPPWYRRVIRLGDAMGIFFAVFAFSAMLQLLWVIRWKPQPRQFSAAWAQTPQPPREHPLLVWIVFDELSFDQTFEHRARDLPLPAFDALRNISTNFTDVQPVGLKTVKIIPSLLSGHTVDDFRFGFDNRFSVHFDGQRGWHPLTGADTVFADARSNGWRTAAVGWYNPYCTIYADALDNCYWTNWDKIDGPMAQRKTASAATSSPRSSRSSARSNPPPAPTVPAAATKSTSASSPTSTSAARLHTCSRPTRPTSSSSTSPSRTAPTSGAASTTTTPPPATAPTSITLSWSTSVLGNILNILHASPRWDRHHRSSCRATTPGASSSGTGSPPGPTKTTTPPVASSTRALHCSSTPPASPRPAPCPPRGRSCASTTSSNPSFTASP